MKHVGQFVKGFMGQGPRGETPTGFSAPRPWTPTGSRGGEPNHRKPAETNGLACFFLDTIAKDS